MANLRPGQDAGSQQGVDLASYISGYVDGEGCFNISLSRRPTLKVGWEVRPSLSVSQNGDRAEVLTLLQAYFGCGTIRPDRSDKTLKWETRSLLPIIDRVLPHFRRHPLLSSKQKDFELFAVLRSYLRGDGSRRAPHIPRALRDRATSRPDEPERKATVSAGTDPAISD